MKLLVMIICLANIILSSCGRAQPAETSKQVTETSAARSETRISPTYFLRLPMGANYEGENDSLSVRVFNYGGYLNTEFTNNGDKPKTIGADYKIQRKVGGEYKDVRYGTVNLIHNGTHVNDMPRVTVQENIRSTDIKPMGSEGLTLAAGDSIQVNFLTLNHEIFDAPEYEGDYRLICGGVTVDFEIICDEAV